MLRLAMAVICVAGARAPIALADDVSFDRDIRPILSDNCFLCHGPDPSSREAGLRLDQREHATADLGGRAAIVPGDPDASALWRRVTETDPGDRMPPVASGKVLDAAQIGKLRAWIAEGAPYRTHWSFIPPTRPDPPLVDNTNWVRNPVDAFVLARIEREGLSPSAQADAVTLLRRLSLDLTGLPPTLEETEAFLADDLETAYASAVDRLLASPHYGERWARHWLDAAQYADSDGFEKDKPRQVWAWRDWVINAFNNNMPYDRFVIEQIAGDLLPDATQDQKVATGFLRNSMINEEGGIDPEQFRMEAMFNRADLVGRAMLGLTVQCAQCHTHKYDPLSQTEYYGLLSYLNNSYEACMTVYSPEEEARRQDIQKQLTAIDQDIKEEHPDWREKMTVFEAAVRAEPEPVWHPLELTFDDTSAGGQKCVPQPDGSYVAQGYAPTRFHPKSTAPAPVPAITAIMIELFTDPNLPRNGPGRSVYGACALSEIELRIAPEDQPIKDFGTWERVEITAAIADVNPPERALDPEFPDKNDRKAVTGPIAMAIDGNQDTAWTTDIGPGRSNVPRHALFKLAQPLELPPGAQLALQLSQTHGGWNSDDNQNNNLGRFRVSVTDATLLPETAYPADIRQIVLRPEAERTSEETARLFRYWWTTQPEFGEQMERAEAFWHDHPEGTTQLVYREMEAKRDTHRLERGDFLQPAEVVEPGVPAFLNPMPEDAPPNRLALGRWLVARDAPTTARAFVNRVWQQFFGTGIVETAADLGAQGAPPSHPELLDWLAVEFMDSGWNIKELHRTIVFSSTYRQSAETTPELDERDPNNRLLARGARFRVEGEIVRDIALAASGLLNPKVGGPSVYPPAPEYLFQPPASYGPKIWRVESDAARYRRALYTFRYRSVPYPVLQAFDTPAGDAPCVRRVRSNTPLQALTALNEPMFMECASSLAAIALAEGGDDDASRLAYVFRRCVTRAPNASELDTLMGFLDKQRRRVDAGELDSTAILGKEGELQPEDSELAAWTLTARVLLNLDETIMRQ
ncbi:MAG: DUF1549 domain-containing protein [Candidatus Hydrogenedentes bacterium]|nr:DUF1549 domain-containing protein [Candidatus Hydrogenedentota bacterium]